MGDIADWTIDQAFSEECEICGELIALCECSDEDIYHEEE